MVCFPWKQVRFVPASGLSGENVSKRDPSGPLSAWYDGPTLLEAIDAFSPAAKAVDKPFRMCVADVTSSGRVGKLCLDEGLCSDKRLMAEMSVSRRFCACVSRSLKDCRDIFIYIYVLLWGALSVSRTAFQAVFFGGGMTIM